MRIEKGRRLKATVDVALFRHKLRVHGITHEQLAEASGLARPYVSGLLGGSSPMTATAALRLTIAAKHFGINLDAPVPSHTMDML